MQRIYLDHNATTRPLPEAVEAMVACMRDGFGNPSSIHAFGQQARRLQDRAREQVAAMIGAAPEEILFTSGGTEADNQALGTGMGPLFLSSIEHPAILNAARHQELLGRSLTLLPVDELGILRMEALEEALGQTHEGHGLLSLMAANNDLGTLQPVREAALLAHARGWLMHSDAVQAAGRIPLDVKGLGVDLLSLSGHKLHGPKGVGALFIRRGLQMAPLIHGGSQERRLRAGTENLPGIVGFGVACEAARRDMEARNLRIRPLRDRLEAGLLAIPGIRRQGHPTLRLPNTLNIGLPGIPGEDLLLNLDLEGIAVSVGSACSSGNRAPSYVLQALGLDDLAARQSLRFSLGFENTETEIDRAIAVVKSVVERLRPI